MSVARLKKELVDCEKDKRLTNISVKIKSRDMKELEGSIKGPPDSPYEGGTFVVSSQSWTP